MVPSCHWTIAGLSLDDIDNYIEQICSPVLSIESSGNHRVDCGKMGLAFGASVNTLSVQIPTIAQAHDCKDNIMSGREVKQATET
jgi:hypothetical protein